MSTSLSSPNTQGPFYVPAAVREVENQDGAVLLDIQQGLCFSLTPVAAHVWRLLRLNCSVEEITNSVCAEFDAPREQIEGDVASFLSSLRQHKLLLDRHQDSVHRGGWLPALWSRLRRLEKV
jgi:hypothetical protein